VRPRRCSSLPEDLTDMDRAASTATVSGPRVPWPETILTTGLLSVPSTAGVWHSSYWVMACARWFPQPLKYLLLTGEVVGILGGDGFTLPVVSSVEVVEVEIEFTDSARRALKSSMGGDEETHVLIVSAQSGGCSGYLYDMEVSKDPGVEGFQRMDVDGVTVLVHDKDSAMLNGIRIDFKDTLMGGGFQIENPNADRSCGCGQSFG